MRALVTLRPFTCFGGKKKRKKSAIHHVFYSIDYYYSLINVYKPDAIPPKKIHMGNMAFKIMENINLFLIEAAKLGVPSEGKSDVKTCVCYLMFLNAYEQMRLIMGNHSVCLVIFTTSFTCHCCLSTNFRLQRAFNLLIYGSVKI